MKKQLLFLTLGILLIIFLNPVLAENEYYKIGEEVNLILVCTIDNAIPSENTTLNLTIRYPNGTLMLDAVETEPRGNGIFNYSLSFQEKGTHYPTLLCVDGENSNSDSSSRYIINPTGEELSSAKSTSYAIILILSILIFLGLLWIGIALPSKNKKDEFTGYIIAVTNIKYLKHLLLGLAYITLVWISYFSWMLVYAFLDFDFLSAIFRLIFTILSVLTLPLFILYVYLTIANLIRDSKVADALQRGLRIS